MFGRRVRMVEPEEVVQAAQSSAEPTEVFFYDDNFFISKRRGKELLRQMIDAEPATCTSTPRSASTPSARTGGWTRSCSTCMWRAGCRIVYLGLESADPATLSRVPQGVHRRGHGGGPGGAHRTGIKTHGMFVFGADSDTLESLATTADFAIEYGLNTRAVPGAHPAAGHPADGSARGRGRIFTKNWSLYDGHHVVFWPKHMTPYELQEAVLQAKGASTRRARWSRPSTRRPCRASIRCRAI